MADRCAKCGSEDIRRIPQEAIQVAIAISWTKTAMLEYHVCVSCGFVETYVADKTLLPAIAEKYTK